MIVVIYGQTDCEMIELLAEILLRLGLVWCPNCSATRLAIMMKVVMMIYWHILKSSFNGSLFIFIAKIVDLQIRDTKKLLEFGKLSLMY